MRCGTCAKKTNPRRGAPRARPNSGFSLLMEALMEALLVILCKAMAVSQVAQLLGVSDGHVWRTLGLITSIRRTLRRTSRPSTAGGLDETARAVWTQLH